MYEVFSKDRGFLLKETQERYWHAVKKVKQTFKTGKKTCYADRKRVYKKAAEVEKRRGTAPQKELWRREAIKIRRTAANCDEIFKEGNLSSKINDMQEKLLLEEKEKIRSEGVVVLTTGHYKGKRVVVELQGEFFLSMYNGDLCTSELTSMTDEELRAIHQQE